jgi:hypothetical protein
MTHSLGGGSFEGRWRVSKRVLREALLKDKKQHVGLSILGMSAADMALR